MLVKIIGKDLKRRTVVYQKRRYIRLFISDATK